MTWLFQRSLLRGFCLELPIPFIRTHRSRASKNFSFARASALTISLLLNLSTMLYLSLPSTSRLLQWQRDQADHDTLVRVVVEPQSRIWRSPPQHQPPRSVNPPARRPATGSANSSGRIDQRHPERPSHSAQVANALPPTTRALDLTLSSVLSAQTEPPAFSSPYSAQSQQAWPSHAITRADGHPADRHLFKFDAHPGFVGQLHRLVQALGCMSIQPVAMPGNANPQMTPHMRELAKKAYHCR